MSRGRSRPHVQGRMPPGCAFYSSDLAAGNFHRTGKVRLNHSFMIPGLIGVSVSTIASVIL